MSEYADLEISLHHRDAVTYTVELRFSLPNSDADIRLGDEAALATSLNLQTLKNLSYDTEAYSHNLTDSLFGDPTLKTAFAQARSSAQSLNAALRLRLMISSNLPELHDLRWEMLRDPLDHSLLTTNETVLFSRYLSSTDWRPVRLRSKEDLSVLVVIANPSDLSDYDLDPIDTQAELERAKKGFGPIPICALPDPQNGRFASLNALIDEIRENTYDILYLVCHGKLIKEEPWLWLEDDQGKVNRSAAIELVERLKGVAKAPRLVVLASCESAGSTNGAALAALGPRLAQAGIPAVLAMQDQISIETAGTFMQVLFRELQRDGLIDRAVAIARSAVRDQPDYWMPALFMRMKSGRIWYVPGFSEDAEDFEKWSSIIGFIHDRTCTPILGPGLLDTLLGSRRDMAVRWAEKSGFPLAPQDREVLPRVAQYLITHQSQAYLPVALREVARDTVLQRYGKAISEDLAESKTWSTGQLTQALTQAMTWFASNNPTNPFQQLAELRLPIYITTDVFDLMQNALIAAGVEPVMRVCPWNKWIPKEMAIYEDTPTPEKPLVYHLFGHISLPNSQVYSEDQFFDYLIGVTLNKNLIPSAVRASLTNSSLLFLGFQMDDWEFRVFFRYLMAQEGREMLKFYSHASAQVEPEEDRIIDVKRAHRYLEDYFESENIGIYWGGTEEFLNDLWKHL